MQVVVADKERISDVEGLNITIQLEDDEPPIFSNSSRVQIFLEDGGPIDLFDPTLTISDADNREEDRVILEVLVTLSNPVEPEDQIVFNGSAISGSNISFTDLDCSDEACFQNLLALLQYNNTNTEPGSFMLDRRFSVQVCNLVQPF